ncbi:hypothetical protein LSM04_003562 [Trypanosoma melophagium]|uniref:uncharacterized protein n=1 Tax=Trypanosoma melophagium TaxID=715481 RepID=UPI00351A4F4A|nr:hypothetical protein LSM04_003562 [Trypanosoma melophagium]
MAGLTSDNISIASAQQYGFTKDRDTCVFCKRRTTPPPGDPLAPVFVFFSLVDCRHYVCQPCALVNCDNAGRYIRCPTCHAVSRLAQSGMKRDGRYASRVPIDDGVSSILSHATRRSSSALPRNYMPQKSSIAPADRNKKRSSSVQFPPDPTASIVPPVGGNVHTAVSLNTAPEEKSPLTHDALERLPADPEYVKRKREKETANAVEKEKPEMVGLYTIKGTSSPRRRSSGERSRSVPLPPKEHKYLVPPIPFAPPPPLHIYTVEEEEEELKKKQGKTIETEPLSNSHLFPLPDEIQRSILASLDKEEQERKIIETAEEHRRNAVVKQRDIQEKEQLAARGKLDNEFDVRLSPQTPMDASEGQVSVTSDDEVPTTSLIHVEYEENPPSEEVKHPFFLQPENWATTSRSVSASLPVLQENKSSALKPQIIEAEDEKLVELQEQKQILQINVDVAPNKFVSTSLMYVLNTFAMSEVQERNMIENVEDMERRILFSSLKQEEVEISAHTMQLLSAQRTAQATWEYQSYVSSSCADLIASETRRRSFIEEMEWEVRGGLSRDFRIALQAVYEAESLRSSEQRLLELKRALIAVVSEESNTRMQLEQDALDELARLRVLCMSAIVEYQRVLEENEIRRGATRVAAERRLYMQQFSNLAEAEDAGRCRLLETEQYDRRMAWTHFVSTMPFTITATAPPSSVMSPPSFSVLRSSCAPETTRSFTVSSALASQQIAALLEEEELERLELRQAERREWYTRKNSFYADCRRLKSVENIVENEQFDHSILKRTLVNNLKRLELHEEEGRIELQQSAWTWFRRLTEKAGEERQQIETMEKLLRSISERSQRVLHRCLSEVQLALEDEENHDRSNIETHERRTRMQLCRDAAKSEELLRTQLQLQVSHDNSGTIFLDAMDAAVREFTTEAMRIAQEEKVERLALMQAERIESLSLTQSYGETRLEQSRTDAKQQLEYLNSTLEITTAVSTWRARCAFLMTEELRSRDAICNDEASRRAWFSADERRERFDAISRYTERLQLAQELARLNAKLQGTIRDESEIRVGIYQEELRTREILEHDAVRYATQVQVRTERERVETNRSERNANRALDDLWQEEEDGRFYIREAERDARRRLRRRAVEESASIALASRDTSGFAGDGLPGRPASGHSPLSDPSSPQSYDEAFVRRWEAARWEELREAQQRLREAEARIAAEAERRTLAEEARLAALAESAALLQEAEERADARIRQAREEAERAALAEKERAAGEKEREALAEAEQRARLEARLRAAEQALTEAQKRAAVGAEERVRTLQQQTFDAIAASREEARKTTEETRRRLEELEERYAVREAAVHVAKANVRVARRRMKAYEDSQQTSPSSTRSSNLMCTSGGAMELTKEMKGEVTSQEVNKPTDFTTAICSNVIRAAIREAVDEIMRATKEAWKISEEAEQRLRVERVRLRRRQAERDQAEQDLIDAENEGILWSTDSNIDTSAVVADGDSNNNNADDDEANAEDDYHVDEENVNKDDIRRTLDLEESVETAQWQNSTRLSSGKEKREEELPPPLPENLICHQCYRSETSACATCALQVCLYCGASIPRRACCDLHHLDFVNTRRLRLVKEQRQQEQEQKQDKEKHRHQLWNERLLERSPPGVQRQLLSSESNTGDDEEVVEEKRERKEEKKKENVEEIQVQGKLDKRLEQRRRNEIRKKNNDDDDDKENDNNKTASVASIEEPRTERKRYEAFFVPLGTHAEPKRPKPPTPNNYVPGIHFSPSNVPKTDRRASPPLRRARNMNKHGGSATFTTPTAGGKSVHESRPRRSTTVPKERTDPFISRQPKSHLHQRQDHQEQQQKQQRQRNPYMTSSTMPVKEPAWGNFDLKPRRRASARRAVQDPLRTSVRESSPPLWTRQAPREAVDYVSTREPSIEFDDDFDDFALRDPTGLGRTYYAGKPVRSDGLNFACDEFVENTSRSFVHQEQYRTTTVKSKKDVEPVNVSRERVPMAAFTNPSSPVRRQEFQNMMKERNTPTLQELDERLRHLQQHRVFDRMDRRSPDIHCMRHHYNCDIDVTTGKYDEYDYENRESDRYRQIGGKSSRIRYPASSGHEPCVTVHLLPRSGSIPPPLTPSGAAVIRGASRAKSRGPSRRTARRSTPRVVSPPWRTDYNSSPLRPPWNVEQPHSFIAKPYKRTLLSTDL